MQLKLIVEGPNNVGKSTLINNILSYSSWAKETLPIVEHSSNKCPNDYTYHEFLINQRLNSIFDRFFVGEYVYPNIFKRDPKMTLDEMFELFNKYDDLAIIFVTADIELISEAYKQKCEEPNWHDIYAEITIFDEAYRQFKSAYPTRCIRIKNRLVGTYKTDTSFSEIQQFIEKNVNYD